MNSQTKSLLPAAPADGRREPAGPAAHVPSGARDASWVVISPCRDEAEFMRATIESMLRQTVRPDCWIIVDDGSTDETPAILAEYARQHEWIEVIRREDRGRRAVGPGVVDAFYAGLERVDLSQFAYICKLDLDLELPPRYFEILLDRMTREPRLGTCSGKPYFRDPTSGALQNERIGDEVSAGMTKLYRTECFNDIGGFVRGVMWDGIDCHKCRMKGWIARSWDEPDLRFIHLRRMGSSYRNLWTGRLRWGRGKWFMGSSIPYMLGVSLYRMAERPYVVGGLGILAGYIHGLVSMQPRITDREYRQFVRRYELRSLLFGKRKTMEQYHRMLCESRTPTA